MLKSAQQEKNLNPDKSWGFFKIKCKIVGANVAARVKVKSYSKKTKPEILPVLLCMHFASVQTQDIMTLGARKQLLELKTTTHVNWNAHRSSHHLFDYKALSVSK